jgi:molybdate transport system substrate-binding protein
VGDATEIRVMSSMATRRVLADLATRFEAQSPWRVALESVGGVDATRRVKAGEILDAVVLARDAIDELIATGHIVAGSRIDLVASPVAVAVRAGASRPDIGTADAVKRAVLAASRVGYSTGPSGSHLAKIFGGWDPALKDRITVASPGVPVGTLVARGDVELGFQQLSELIGLEGIEVVGLLPAPIQVVTIFSGGVARTSTQPDAVRTLLSFMAAPSATEVKRIYGMDAASGSAQPQGVSSH